MKSVQSLGKFLGSTFAIWVVIAAAVAMVWPSQFTGIAPYVSILLGIIMFGMGMTLTLKDFKLVLSHPKSILVGVFAQYLIMPGLAFLLAKAMNLPPEIAVGVILIGACPGGTASNVMTFLAKGNTALSVTITSITTLLAPILTPAIVYLMASQWISVSASAMFISVFKIVLVPIILGVIVKIILKERSEAATDIMPIISIIGIVIIVASVVSNSREQIISNGIFIFIVVILHNGLGLLLGFLTARMFKLSYRDQKAISIEVGMQNSALGATLAMLHFGPMVAVPSAIASVWHNISGPIIAAYWSKKADKINTEEAFIVTKELKE
ncbi:bile acid:sodium symporter family protein [Kurthia sibirica]|uniref:Sodium transporter n=1 Tax=Kurthia sibirica TaxID=202750 RepID=A0A2U3AQ44_9BACL|nr:bile acid:sodium symporter family protein [Kurthia sibirica]PWI26661.1 sodium transporter [Kurthia sibirica]GEK32926.1 sodium transporter [Kurthia sibirica]